jgi:hypothetical protein
MQDFMFATLLFLVYFCFACYLLHNPKAEATTSNPVPVVASANPTVTPQVKQDDPQTQGYSDAERNVSRIERPVPLSQGSESLTESGDSVALFQEEFQAPYEMSPRLPISASPRLFRETVAPEPTTNEAAATPIEPSQDEEMAADICSEPVTLEPHPLSTEVAATQTTLVADLKLEPVSCQQPEVHTQVLAVIDNLGKREARKLMGGLKLQQKRNRVELSTELMVASIRREFKADPERVIEVICARLSPAVVKRLLTDLPKWRDEADVRTALRC